MSESTMKCHRRDANMRRRSIGLPPLSRGPRYSEDASAEQYRIFRLLPREEKALPPIFPTHPGSDFSATAGTCQVEMNCHGSDLQSPSTGAKANDVMNISVGNICAESTNSIVIGNSLIPPTSQNRSQDDEGMCPHGDVSCFRVSCSSDARSLPALRTQTEKSCPLGISFGQEEGVLWDDTESAIALDDQHKIEDDQLESHSRAENQPILCTEVGRRYHDTLLYSDSRIMPSSETTAMATDGELKELMLQSIRTHRWRPEVRAKFDVWAQREKQWIQMFVDFGVKQTLMSRILELLEADITAVTVKRNLEKYTELYPISYECCRGHMLLNKSVANESGNQASDSTDQDRDLECEVCLEKKTKLTRSAFEYIPLLPRIRAWVANEKSFNELYDYRDSLRRSREESPSEYSNGAYFEDFVDGSLYKEILDCYGGKIAFQRDIFVSVSTDGFQTFDNNSYDCWPIVAMIHNLHPNQRFLFRNLVPLGFVKGPTEPVRVDTFLKPFVEEVLTINRDGGTRLKFYDGSEHSVRIHPIFFTGDSPAIKKISGTMGPSAKCPCRDCDVSGYRRIQSNRYYFPSKIRLLPTSRERRPKWIRLYSLNELPMRTPRRIEEILQQLESCPGITEMALIRRDSGIQRRTEIFKIATVFPFASFPHDTMHIFMNISKDLLDLLKGTNHHLSNLSPDDFVMNDHQWKLVNADIKLIGRGTPLSLFDRVPRSCELSSSWKAAECIDFFQCFAAILFEGHIPEKYLRCITCFSRLIDLCRRPALTGQDL